jgi:hypothetical protein
MIELFVTLMKSNSQMIEVIELFLSCMSHLQDNEMIELFVTLMKSNIDVGIVTAAGYPGEASKFENRIQGLLKAFSQYRLPATITNRCAGRLLSRLHFHAAYGQVCLLLVHTCLRGRASFDARISCVQQLYDAQPGMLLRS